MIGKILPIITEKSSHLAKKGKYSFLVPASFSKKKVAEAIQSLYKVRVIKINSQILKPKVVKRFGRYAGKTKKTKKVILTLKKGEYLKIFGQEKELKKEKEK